MFKVWSKWDWLKQKTREPPGALTGLGVGELVGAQVLLGWSAQSTQVWVCVKDTNGLFGCPVADLCDNIKEKNGKFCELAANLISCLFGWVEHNRWLVSMAGMSLSCRVATSCPYWVLARSLDDSGNWGSLHHPIFALWWLSFEIAG